jgi:CRISPR/Cas system-associated endonuclease/helicase Cas3
MLIDWIWVRFIRELKDRLLGEGKQALHGCLFVSGVVAEAGVDLSILEASPI